MSLPCDQLRSVTYLTRAPSQWGWQEVRDYVVREIERRFGVCHRDPLKESGIFKGFVKRWGEQAGPIARLVFESANGWWGGQPVSVTRFCKGSDPFFGDQIAKRLAESRTET